jgi:arylsulfatase A-like enzyme
MTAAWFGLVTGLLEGTGFLAFQKLDWLNWDMALMTIAHEIVWISALFDLLLFGVLGLALATLARLCPKLPVTRQAVFLFAFLSFLDWLSLTGRIRTRPVLLLAAGLAVALGRWFHKHEATALRFWRRSLPWVAATAVLALVGIEGGLWLQERSAIAQLPALPTGSPNILVIVVDTLRADHLSCYGYARSTSQNLDYVARQGVLFESAFAGSSWTLPSHASLLTGRYPYEHGADSTKPLDGRYPTLAEALRALGYRTAVVSANNIIFCRGKGFGRGFIRFEDYFHSAADMAVRTLYGRMINKFVLRHLGFEDLAARKRAAEVNRSALRWIDRHRAKPFFAFLNYFDTHDPYLPPQPYRNKFSESKNPGGILNFRMDRIHPKMTPEQVQSEIDAYDGAIAYVDDHIGQLFAELHRRGIAQNTLVVITSDHGEAFGEHGLFTHRKMLYREVIQVPLIIWWPEHVPAGVRVTRPVTNVALPATVMDLVGAGGQAQFPNLSLTGLWKFPVAQNDCPYPLAELAQEPSTKSFQFPAYHGWLKSLMSSQWHYIVHEKLGVELYDWKNDPREVHNLVATPEGQAVVSSLRVRLQSQLSQGVNAKSPEPLPE